MRTRAILFLAVLGIGVAMLPSRAQQSGDQGREDELVILQLRIEAERARVKEAEARLNQAMRTLDHMLRRHPVPVGEAMDQAECDVDVKKAQLEVQQIELKEAEVRLQQAKRPQAGGETSASPSDRRLAEMDRKLDLILKQLEGLKGR